MSLKNRYQYVRKITEELCRALEVDDCNMQSMPDASPGKWNLGHTTWFFDAFILQEFASSYKPINLEYNFCFNSYYESAGERLYRPHRHFLSRPTLKEVYEYRQHVDESIVHLLDNIESLGDKAVEVLDRMEIGLNHEEQHQELFLTDLKHILFSNPLQPAYTNHPLIPAESLPALSFFPIEEGVHETGHGENNFAYDNEKQPHKIYLNPIRMSSRKISNGEFIEFIESGGYSDFRHWLSDAWATVQREQWQHPLYWEKRDGEWWEYTLYGWQKVDKNLPIVHVSFYEADAYARWHNARLPTEAEWESVAALHTAELESGHFFQSPDESRLHVSKFKEDKQPPVAPHDFFGNVWEWTMSQYLPYPGFRIAPGAIGEYNGKFMNDQRVLRGGSFGTPKGHTRLTYRNFFQGYQRWQFSGFRLVMDGHT